MPKVQIECITLLFDLQKYEQKWIQLVYTLTFKEKQFDEKSIQEESDKSQ